MSQHLRISTHNGPVHVFIPDGYVEGGTAIYVHGFYDTVDSAWVKQKLPEQFAASQRNAIFIAVEAPQQSGAAVYWKSLGELTSTVESALGRKLLDPVVAIAHSGGFSTVASWLSDPRLAHVILLDALYGSSNQFTAWANRPGRTFTLLVGKSGTPRIVADSILSKLLGLVQRVGTSALSAAEKSAKTLFVVAPQAHMQLVEPQPGPVSSWVLPTMLSRSPLAAIGSLSGGILLLLLGGALFYLGIRE